MTDEPSSTTPPSAEEESSHQTVARASGTLFASQLASRVLGMLRNTAMTAMFALGIQTDAYGLAITIPDLLFMLVAGGGLSSAFIPVFSELLYTKREREAWKFFSVVTTFCSLVVGGLIAVAWFAAPWVAHVMAKEKTNDAGVNISAQLEPHIVSMGRILLPAQFAFLIGSLLLGTLYARKQFLAPALAPNVYNVGIIIGAIVGGLSPLGISGMPWGGLIGAVVGNLVFPAIFMRKAGSSFRPSLDLKTEGVRQFFRLLAPVIFGFSLPSVVGIITNFFAARYSEGINTVYLLSNTLMQAPSGIFGQSLALAVFPVLAQFYANRKMDLYAAQMAKTVRTVVYLAVPSAVLMLALAPEIVHLMFAYGRSAKNANLDEITLAIRVYTPSVVAWCIQPVLMRGFFSVHKTFLPIGLSTLVTGLFIAMCAYCTSHGLPYISLAWATDIAAVLLVVLLYVALEATVGASDRKGLIGTFVKTLLASAVMGAVVYAIAFGLRSAGLAHSRLAEALVFLFLSVAALWIYYGVTRRLGLSEIAYFDRALGRLLRRGSRA